MNKGKKLKKKAALMLDEEQKEEIRSGRKEQDFKLSCIFSLAADESIRQFFNVFYLTLTQDICWIPLLGKLSKLNRIFDKIFKFRKKL